MPDPDQTSPHFCRRLWPGDENALFEHLERLDTESRRSRFGMAVGPEFLKDHAHRALGPRGIVYGCFIEGTLRGVAELHPAHESRAANLRYEAAFSVERAYRGQGIASELMALLLRAARNRRADDIYLLTQPDNLAMRALAQKFHGHLGYQFGQIEAHFDSEEPTPWSVGAEMLDEVRALPSAILDWQKEWWRSVLPGMGLPTFWRHRRGDRDERSTPR